MIASGEVEMISLLTPPAIRDDVIYPVFEAGIHALVEKPFVERPSDAVVFVKAAEAADVKLAVNQQFRFMQDVVADSAAIQIQTIDVDLDERTFHQEEAFTRAVGGRTKRLVDAVETGTELPHSGRDNLETMQIVDGAYLSAERGEPVTVEELKVGLK